MPANSQNDGVEEKVVDRAQANDSTGSFMEQTAFAKYVGKGELRSVNRG